MKSQAGNSFRNPYAASGATQLYSASGTTAHSSSSYSAQQVRQSPADANRGHGLLSALAVGAFLVLLFVVSLSLLLG